jgi:hypothetical protein
MHSLSRPDLPRQSRGSMFGTTGTVRIPAGQTGHSPSRGDAELLRVKVATATADLATCRYPDSPLAGLRELVRFEWDAMSE